MEKIRIAFFSDILEEDFDGVSRTVHQIIRRIPTSDFDFLFITPHPPKNKESVPFKVIQCPSMAFPGQGSYRIALPFLRPSLKKILDQFDPHLVHFTTPSMLGSYALSYGKKRKIPVLTTYHSHFYSYIEYYFGRAHMFFWNLGKIFLWKYPKCDLVLAPSTEMKHFLMKERVSASKIKLWPRGVELDDFNPKMRDLDWRNNVAPENEKLILFVSRLVREKDLATLVNISDIFETQGDNVKFVIVGEGPDEEDLKINMPNALFMGKRTGEDLSKIFASCDVFLFPSLTETFGNVVLEAMASGLPVVAAAAGGPLDIVKDGKTGFFAEPKNALDFYQKTKRILEDSELYNRMSRAAIDHARLQDWDNLCSDLFATYKKFIRF